MTVVCSECGTTAKTTTVAYRQLWCRKSYVDKRPVKWSCYDCTQQAVARARMARNNAKRFNLFLG